MVYLFHRLGDKVSHLLTDWGTLFLSDWRCCWKVKWNIWLQLAYVATQTQNLLFEKKATKVCVGPLQQKISVAISGKMLK